MAVQVRTQFGDLYLADALPSIREIIQDKFDQYPDAIPSLFQVDGSSRSIEQSVSISGFGNFVETDEGSDASADIFYQRYDKTYTHLKYTLEFKLTEEMVADEEHGVIRKLPRALARSAHNTRQTLAADHFNNAFSSSFTGGDGKELCATDHTLVGGTEQNELTTAADLSVASLREAINTLEDTTDDRGLLLNIKARKLLVPNELKWDAHELLKSVLRSDTSENAANAFSMEGLEPFTWNYLTDNDAWFLVASPEDTDLHWYNRMPLTIKQYEDESAGAVVTQGKMRMSSGWNDWRGVFGSPGA